jgi:hypothetical protein
MGTKVTLGQNEHARRSHGFKLVKSLVHYCETALFSDSIHHLGKVGRLGDPNAVNIPEQVLHLFF